VYLVTGGWTGVVFRYVERLPALQEVLFIPGDKFSIPTDAYWALLGVSLLAAVAAGFTITRVAGWHRPPATAWYRFVLASVLVATSVPFQAWLVHTKWLVNEELTTFTPIDTEVIAVTGIIALIVYAVGWSRGAQWSARVSGSILAIAILAALPIGVFALFLTVAAYIMTGRLEIGFSVLLVLAGVGVLFLSVLFGEVFGITATWPLAEASASALFGYQLHRAPRGSLSLILRRVFLT
jgi:hypothetical protein